jgi:hypothetical protein
MDLFGNFGRSNIFCPFWVTTLQQSDSVGLGFLVGFPRWVSSLGFLVGFPRWVSSLGFLVGFPRMDSSLVHFWLDHMRHEILKNKLDEARGTVATQCGMGLGSG